MRRELRGKRLLVTGATGAIGRNVARLARAAGCRLLLTARRADKLAELASSLGGEAVTHPADVTKADDRAALIATARDRFGGLDILINNAGVGSWGHFATSNESILRQVMELNFFAPAELMRLTAPLLTEGDQPAIVNVASVNARRALPAWTEYCASKFALCGLSEALRAEYSRFDIDVLLVVPGVTKVDDLGKHLLRSEGKVPIDYSRGQEPAAVAAAIIDALRTNRSETVIGRDAKWLLRVNRWMPRLVDRLAARKVTKAYQQNG